MAKDKNGFLTEVYIVLLAVASGAFLIALYQCITLLWQDSRRRRLRQGGQGEIQLHGANVSFENSIAGLIPAHKHKKVAGSMEYDDTCSVCLNEFEEGEELRTLPECTHTFHVPCIDMWLYSHRNCPFCRADATPTTSPQVSVVCIVVEPESDQQAIRTQTSDVPQDLVVQSTDV